MYCAQPMPYTIRQGDTLDRIAKEHRTTPTMIVAHNLNIDPNNLRVGSTIMICPGKGLTEAAPPHRPMPAPMPTPKPAPMPGPAHRPIPTPAPMPSPTHRTMPTPMPMPTPKPMPPETMELSPAFVLSNNMREVWEQHVYWTRLLLISIAERLKDEKDVTNRVLQNPNDIANLFACCYPPEVTQKIAQLLTEHLKIGAALITALRDGKTAEAETLTRQWYANADQMADMFSSINPHYDREELRKMLHTHLQLTTQEVSTRLAGNYPADIAAMGEVEREAMMMADYFTAGLVKQFPEKFR